MRRLVISLIKLYQKTLSPDHGIPKKLFPNLLVCRFAPTCSDYTIEALKKYGTLKGLFVGLKRIVRCNPLSKGGFDPVR